MHWFDIAFLLNVASFLILLLIMIGAALLAQVFASLVYRRIITGCVLFGSSFFCMAVLQALYIFLYGLPK